ncbi:MAG: hypothetical protein JST84_10470 [Acidobacteria bacterium]|nr:hypothetical protein [Acidobacteriota bacterium]
MSQPSKMSEPIFILAGTSQQYTDARRKLALIPTEAFWLTSPAKLTGKQAPKVVRYGDWKSLPKIQEIEAALIAVAAEVIDLS